MEPWKHEHGEQTVPTLYSVVSLGCRSLCWTRENAQRYLGVTCLGRVFAVWSVEPSHHEHCVSRAIRTHSSSRAPPMVHWNSSPSPVRPLPAPQRSAQQLTPPSPRCPCFEVHSGHPATRTGLSSSPLLLPPASRPFQVLRFLPSSFHLFRSFFHPNTQPPSRIVLYPNCRTHSLSIPGLVSSSRRQIHAIVLQPVESESFS
jgi:hypothetical protein